MYFQAAGRTPPPGSASTRSPLAAPASTPPALLAARFTIVVVIEIFKIDYLKNSVLNKYISIKDVVIMSP